MSDNELDPAVVAAGAGPSAAAAAPVTLEDIRGILGDFELRMEERVTKAVDAACSKFSPAGGKAASGGSRTEIALLDFGQRLRLDDMEGRLGERQERLLLRALPFTSARKRMSSLVEWTAAAHVSGNGSSDGSSSSSSSQSSSSSGSASGRSSSSSGSSSSSSSSVNGNGSYGSGSSQDGSHMAGSNTSAVSEAVVEVETSVIGRLFTKGAAELVLELCSKQMMVDGSIVPLLDEQKQRLTEELCGQGLRMLALAYRDVPLHSATESAAGGSSSDSSSSNAQNTGSNGSSVSDSSNGSGNGSSSNAAAHPVAASSAVATAAAVVMARNMSPEELEKELVLVGVVGLQDPLRPEVIPAMKECKRAGITVRMLTGDNVRTGASIAKQCGILPQDLDLASALTSSTTWLERLGTAINSDGAASSSSDASRGSSSSGSSGSSSGGSNGKGGSSRDGSIASVAERTEPLILEGPVFRKLVQRPDGSLNKEAFLALWPQLRVLGRCSPADKYLLVTAVRSLRSEGRLQEVVAVTGDGTNDAPALSAADVSFAMASGTSIAKDAADILLLDDSFASIVAAVKWGRNVYGSVTKFLQFQLTANVVAVTTAGLGAVVLQASPLTVVQMLWVNLLMDSLASLALATEAPNDAMLDLAPVRPDQPLITRTVAKHIIGQAIFQLAILGGMVVCGPQLVQLGSSVGQPVTATAAALGNGLQSAVQTASAAVTDIGSSVQAVANVAANLGSSGLHAAATTTALTLGGGGDGSAVDPVTAELIRNTVIFNTFVLMQLFNQINCRRVRDETNVLEGITHHPLFVGIVASEAVLQVLIVQYGGEVFSTHPLNGQQWVLCAGLGAATLVVRAALRLIPSPEPAPTNNSTLTA